MALRAAVAFLTPVPAGAAADSPDARTLAWFPVVGALVGAAVGAVWWVAGEGMEPLVAAALAVLSDVVLTGALHLDGLADTADGMLSHADGPERRLAIMRSPDVGAFGVVAVAVVLLLQSAALASMDVDVPLVAAVWSASRAAMAVALVTQPYVGGGLGRAFLDGRRGPLAAVAVAVPLALVLLAERPAVAGGAVVAVALTGAAVVALGRRRLGGVTGDVLGAAGVVGQTVALVVASARW